MALSSLTFLCPCLLKSHAEPSRVLLKVKVVPLSGFLQSWPWPGLIQESQESPVSVGRAQSQPAGSPRKLFNG